MATPKQTYWEDVKEGDEIKPFSLKLTWTEVVKQVSGTQDYYAVHHDPEFARSGGHKELFFNTGWYQGCFDRLLSDFYGTGGWLKKFKMEMRRMNHLGDTATFKGRVVKKYEDQGNHYVDVDIWAENQREGVTTPASATVILPTKG